MVIISGVPIFRIFTVIMQLAHETKQKTLDILEYLVYIVNGYTSRGSHSAIYVKHRLCLERLCHSGEQMGNHSCLPL